MEGSLSAFVFYSIINNMYFRDLVQLTHLLLMTKMLDKLIHA
jgi:hypothetical protein